MSEMIQFISEEAGEGNYYNLNELVVVPSKYVIFPQNDEDIEQVNLAALAERSKAFDFLNDLEEDIYDLNDGQPV